MRHPWQSQFVSYWSNDQIDAALEVEDDLNQFDEENDGTTDLNQNEEMTSYLENEGIFQWLMCTKWIFAILTIVIILILIILVAIFSSFHLLNFKL